MKHVAVENSKKVGKFLCALAVVFGLCVGWAPGAAAQALTKLRVGTLPIVTQLPLFTALDKGYFKDAGLDVEVSNFHGGAPLLQALHVDAVDIAGAVNVGSYLGAVAQGFDDVVIAGDAGTGTDITLMMVRKDSGLNSVKDLAGKRVGIPNLKSLNWAYHMEYLGRHGVDTSTIRWIEIGIPGAPAALLTRQVDAADEVQPFATVVMQSGQANGLYNVFEKIAPGGLISVQVARQKWAQAHADEIARFVGALKRAFDYNNIHQQEARKRLTQHTKVNEKLAKAIPWPVMKLSVERNDLQVPMDLSVKYGLLKQPVPIDSLIFATARPQ